MVLVKGNTTSAVLSMLSSTLGLTGETICSLGLGQARQSTLQSYTQPAKHSPSTRPVFPPFACICPCHLGKMGPFHMQLLCTWSPLCFWRRSGCWSSATRDTCRPTRPWHNSDLRQPTFGSSGAAAAAMSWSPDPNGSHAVLTGISSSSQW